MGHRLQLLMSRGKVTAGFGATGGWEGGKGGAGARNGRQPAIVLKSAYDAVA